MEHRIVSLLPLSHLLEQAVGVFYAISVGASVLYVRSRNPRVIFDALREHRVTSMVVVPAGPRPVLERHRARGREVRPREGLRRPPVDRPAPPDAAAPAALPAGPCAARWLVPALHVGRRVPPAGAPAGLGGHGRHRPPGLRRDGDRDRVIHHAAGPRAGHRGLGTGGHRDAPLARWRGPVPRPVAVQGLLAGAREDRRGLHRGRLVHDGRRRAFRRGGSTGPVRPEPRHDRPAQRLQRLSRGHRERPADRRSAGHGRARDEAGPDRGDRPRAVGLARSGPRASRWTSIPPARRRSSARRSTRRSRPRTNRSARTSTSPAGASGPTRTSRERTP